MPKKPNLLYVFADQLRYQSVGYAGDTKARTPNIDAFAAQSCNFWNAVSNHPVCAPYRASLFTGKHTSSTGMVINELRLKPNQRCLGHVLTEAGYSTSYIGKWHLYADEFGNHDDPKNGFVPRGPHRLGFDGEWKAFGFNHNHFNGYYYEESPEKKVFPAGTYEPDGQTDLAIDFLKRAAQTPDTPFAMMLSWGPPHDPWNAEDVPARFLELFKDEQFPNPPNYKATNDNPYTDEWGSLKEEERAQLEEWRRVYYAQTACVDWNFGRLLQALEELGLSDDTIVIFTSDHGEMMGAQGRRAKGIFYEEACRIPFLLRWPGRVPVHATDALLSTVDILPTLCGLLDLETPATAEGIDLSAIAKGDDGPQPEAVLLQGTGAIAIWEDGHEWRALRNKQYTYARYLVDGHELLFDHQNDPFELHNLATEPAHAATLERLRTQMADKMASINDTYEPSTFYRDHWVNSERHIIASAKGPFISN
ncbi:DUF229 domain-containing protein [bacterium]|nr:MAG: DUF229 domain-containing protein [bacterium]